jgi:hypothetical protein
VCVRVCVGAQGEEEREEREGWQLKQGNEHYQHLRPSRRSALVFA